jgi:hypothetical protein
MIPTRKLYRSQGVRWLRLFSGVILATLAATACHLHMRNTVREVPRDTPALEDNFPMTQGADWLFRFNSDASSRGRPVDRRSQGRWTIQSSLIAVSF